MERLVARYKGYRIDRSSVYRASCGARRVYEVRRPSGEVIARAASVARAKAHVNYDVKN